MSKPFEISEEKISEFISHEKLLYACGEFKKFEIAINSPNYVITNLKTKQENRFLFLKEAVEYFNNLIVVD
jgi:hypothetical protein